MPDIIDVIKGELNVTAANMDPVLPKDETATERAIPIEETIFASKAESEIQMEYSEMEFPILEAEDRAAIPRIRPCITKMAAPVKGFVTVINELTTGVLVENA